MERGTDVHFLKKWLLKIWIKKLKLTLDQHFSVCGAGANTGHQNTNQGYRKSSYISAITLQTATHGCYFYFELRIACAIGTHKDDHVDKSIKNLGCTFF